MYVRARNKRVAVCSIYQTYVSYQNRFFVNNLRFAADMYQLNNSIHYNDRINKISLK